MDFEVNKVKSVIFPNTHIYWNLLFHMLFNPIVQMVWICLTLSNKCFANFQNKNHEYKVIDELNVTTVYKISVFFFQTCSSSLNSIWCEGNHFLILYAGGKKPLRNIRKHITCKPAQFIFFMIYWNILCHIIICTRVWNSEFFVLHCSCEKTKLYLKTEPVPN